MGHTHSSLLPLNGTHPSLHTHTQIRTRARTHAHTRTRTTEPCKRCQLTFIAERRGFAAKTPNVPCALAAHALAAAAVYLVSWASYLASGARRERKGARGGRGCHRGRHKKRGIADSPRGRQAQKQGHPAREEELEAEEATRTVCSSVCLGANHIHRIRLLRRNINSRWVFWRPALEPRRVFRGKRGR